MDSGSAILVADHPDAAPLGRCGTTNTRRRLHGHGVFIIFYNVPVNGTCAMRYSNKSRTCPGRCVRFLRAGVTQKYLVAHSTGTELRQRTIEAEQVYNYHLQFTTRSSNIRLP